LIFSSDRQIRFLPAANFHGTPGSLSVYLADNSVNLSSSVTGSTNSGTRYDITNASYGGTATAGAWTSTSKTLGTSVAAVNDAPTAAATTLAAAAGQNCLEKSRIVTVGRKLVDEEGVSSVRTEGSGESGSGGSRPGFGGRMPKLPTLVSK
jgi:hypothetical protein